MADYIYTQRVQEHRRSGEPMGLHGSPSFFLNVNARWSKRLCAPHWASTESVVSMNTRALARAIQRCVSVLGLAMASGCGALLAPVTPPPSLFPLDVALIVARPAATQLSDSTPSLVVSPTRASAGFDSARITFVSAIASTGTFRAVGSAAAGFSGDPYGGGVAAYRAVLTVMQRLAGFCAEAASSPRR